MNGLLPVANSDGTFGSRAPTKGSPLGGGSRIPGPPTPAPTRDQLRVMVAGESGLGKTTFLNNIFRHLNGGEDPMELEAVLAAQGRGMFGQSKTLKIEERNFVFRTPVPGGSGVAQHEYNFYLVDTPGYGDHDNVNKSFQPVLKYIVEGNKKYLAGMSTGRIPDKDDRTDVCIYFIAAHRCKPIDIEYMKQLSKVVAVIPVIGKSDSMTVEEMRDFKAEIVRDADAASGLQFFQFSEGTWNKCKTALKVGDQPNWLGEKQPPPYAVISSKIDEHDQWNNAPPEPVRRYPWGTCHVMETAHSDNRYLQCLLLQVGFQDMKDEMRRRHEKFRRDQAIPIPIGPNLRRRASDLTLQFLEPNDEGQRGKNLFYVVALVAVACALLAIVLQQLQGWMVGVNPPGSSADWGDIISKIKKLEGVGRILESAEWGEDPLNALKDVLVEYYKKRSETQ